MPDTDERESPRTTERSAPSAPAERGLSDDTELVDLGGDRYQVRQMHRIVGTLVESGSGHQAFSVMGRNLGTFSSRRKAVDAMTEAL